MVIPSDIFIGYNVRKDPEETEETTKEKQEAPRRGRPPLNKEDKEN